MVEPVTIVLGITSIINFLGMGFTWLKKLIRRKSSRPITLSTHLVTHATTTLLSPIQMDMTSKFERNHLFFIINYSLLRLTIGVDYESFTQAQELSEDMKLDKETSSTNSSSTIVLIFVFGFVLAVAGLIVYRHRMKLKKNIFNFRQTEKSLETPPSLTTSQI